MHNIKRDKKYLFLSVIKEIIPGCLMAIERKNYIVLSANPHSSPRYISVLSHCGAWAEDGLHEERG
jgi:hypothetical protein